jgi:hypothetical protein
MPQARAADRRIARAADLRIARSLAEAAASP